MAFINKSDILQSRSNIKTQIIDVPEWGADAQVIIVELSGTQRDEFEASMVIQATKRGQLPGMNMKNVRARLVSKCIVNPDDFDVVEGVATLKVGYVAQRLFGDHDVNALGEVSARALDRVFDACQKLSGITEADVIELAGDLKNDQSADFGSS